MFSLVFFISSFFNPFSSEAQYISPSSGPGGCMVSTVPQENTGYCVYGTDGNHTECRRSGEGNRCGWCNDGSCPW